MVVCAFISCDYKSWIIRLSLYTFYHMTRLVRATVVAPREPSPKGQNKQSAEALRETLAASLDMLAMEFQTDVLTEQVQWRTYLGCLLFFTAFWPYLRHL